MTLPSWSTGTQSEAELGTNHLAKIRRLETLIQLRWAQIGYVELHWAYDLHTNDLFVQVQGLGNPGGPQNPIWTLVRIRQARPSLKHELMGLVGPKI
jgi:hypothetical protein